MFWIVEPLLEWRVWVLSLVISVGIWLLVRVKPGGGTGLEGGLVGSGKIMVILGSGGHTKEILNIVWSLTENFDPRVYIYTECDKFSLKKARDLEKKRENGKGRDSKYIPVVRIRDVGQSLVHALGLRAPGAFFQASKLLMKEKPDVLLCNGPGICVPYVLLAVVLNTFFITNTKIVYVESICRVNTLSLTGRIVVQFAHQFFVQWEELLAQCKEQYPLAEVVYIGRLT